MELSCNTVESRMILHHEDKMREFGFAALAALKRMEHDVESATMRQVVTYYKDRRNFLGMRYCKTHTMEYATWEIDRQDGVIFLCSDGKVYSQQRERNFWGCKVKRLMPVENITPGRYHGHDISYDEFIGMLNRLGIEKLPRPRMELRKVLC